MTANHREGAKCSERTNPWALSTVIHTDLLSNFHRENAVASGLSSASNKILIILINTLSPTEDFPGQVLSRCALIMI